MASEKKEKLEGWLIKAAERPGQGTANTGDTAQIKSADMSEEMQQEAVEVGKLY